MKSRHLLDPDILPLLDLPQFTGLTPATLAQQRAEFVGWSIVLSSHPNHKLRIMIAGWLGRPASLTSVFWYTGRLGEMR